MPARADTTIRSVVVVALVAIGCSLLVSVSAVTLRPAQERNRELNRIRNILIVTGLWQPGDGGDVEAIFAARIETRIVDLQTGEFVAADKVSDLPPGAIDPRYASTDPAHSHALPASEDLAGLGRRERYQPVYLLRENGRLDQIVLPVRGKGLWSTMYAFVSLESDFETVRGIVFYRHGETPGLGAEIENADWAASWRGKRIHDDTGDVAIQLVKGTAPAADEHAVDGISGATLTANGVTRLMQFWFGDGGYGPWLAKQKNASTSGEGGDANQH